MGRSRSWFVAKAAVQKGTLVDIYMKKGVQIMAIEMYLFSITMKEYHLSGFVISYFLD